MAPPTSKQNQLKDYTSLLTTLHRSHTSDIKNGLLSSLSRPTSSSSSSPSLLSPVHPFSSSSFSSFPLFPSQTASSSSSTTLSPEILILANTHLRTLLPPPSTSRLLKRRRRPDEDERDFVKDSLRSLDESHEGPLVLSTLQVVASTLGLLAMGSPVEVQDGRGNKRRKKKAKGEGEEKGWERVLRVLGNVEGVEDCVKERTRARLEQLFGERQRSFPVGSASLPPVGCPPPLPEPKKRAPRKKVSKESAGTDTGGEKDGVVADGREGEEQEDD